MNRSDSRKEMTEGLSRMSGEGEDSSMARTPAAAREGARKHADYEDRSQEGDEKTEVKSGHGIGLKTVEADYVMGEGGKSKTRTATAEGEPDMASAKANRKEAMEPEREDEEKAAIGRDRTVAHKNSMGWGEREVIARNTT